MTDRAGAIRRRVPTRRSTAVASAVVALVVLASGCINNGAWSAAPAPVAPVQALPTAMTDVSCVTADWCLAVGWMGRYPLAEVWNGSAWSVITAPSLGNEDNTQGVSVDCGTTTSCVAKVSRTNSSPTVYDDVVVWDGEEWLVVAGAEGAYVDPLPYSCASDGSCLIVDNQGSATIVWDGDTATSIPFSTTSPAWDVNAIECFSADLCVAATSYSISVWDGSTWTEDPDSDSFPIFVEGASAFACSAVDDCLAVGLNAEETGPTSATWDGSAWTEIALPAGVTSTGSLTCVGDLECLLPASTGMLAWVGGGWVQAPSPPGTWGISCLPQWCLGVGRTGTPTAPIAATYEWTYD